MKTKLIQTILIISILTTFGLACNKPKADNTTMFGLLWLWLTNQESTVTIQITGQVKDSDGNAVSSGSVTVSEVNASIRSQTRAAQGTQGNAQTIPLDENGNFIVVYVVNKYNYHSRMTKFKHIVYDQNGNELGQYTVPLGEEMEQGELVLEDVLGNIGLTINEILKQDGDNSESFNPPVNDIVPETYSIGGTITGLTASGLVLQNNGGDDLSLNSGATSFTFSTLINNGNAYNVTIKSQISGLICFITSGSGTVSGDHVSNVLLECDPFPTSLGLLKTGQTSCYEESGGVITVSCNGSHVGQDAYEGNTTSRSYTDNGNGTITDNVTGFIWQKCSMGQNNDSSCSGTTTTIDWAGAVSYCNQLNLASISWELPSKYQLASIVDYGNLGGITINLTYFPNTQSGDYWSKRGMVVKFEQDTGMFPKEFPSYVRCVSKP